MTNDDTYRTIASVAEGNYSESRSKFIAFAIPVDNVDDIHSLIKSYQNKYCDARHVCYAYMLGHKRETFRVNDNGEPSGTAGRPILGQINSNELTDILIIVIRYFGGIKLGTSGLIVAYRTAAAQAIANAQIISKTIDEIVKITFEYPFLNSVMHCIKELNPVILEQQFEMNCNMTLRIRQSMAETMKDKLKKIETLKIL
jgi:uncharacterized YigZ family protein